MLPGDEIEAIEIAALVRQTARATLRLV